MKHRISVLMFAGLLLIGPVAIQHPQDPLSSRGSESPVKRSWAEDLQLKGQELLRSERWDAAASHYGTSYGEFQVGIGAAYNADAEKTSEARERYRLRLLHFYFQHMDVSELSPCFVIDAFL